MIPAVIARQGWTIWHFLGAVLLGAAAVAITWTAWADILLIASIDEEQSHIFLVPIVAAWMIHARRARLRNCSPTRSLIGPAIVAVGIALWMFGFHRSVLSFWHAGAVLVVIGSVLSCLGAQVLVRFLPAFVVLAFLVPVPASVRGELSIRLQTAAAAITQGVLETIGVAVERVGNLLTIEGKQVAVAEACNGMRMVFGLVLVTFAFAYGMPLRNSTRVFLVAISPVIALTCNIIRLIPTVLLYGGPNEALAEKFHDVAGWLMLPIAFLILLGIVRTLRWALIPVNRFTLAYQ